MARPLRIQYPGAIYDVYPTRRPNAACFATFRYYFLVMLCTEIFQQLSRARIAPASLVIAFFLAASAAVAGESGGYEGREWAFLDAKSVMSAAAEITLANYPDCDE